MDDNRKTRPIFNEQDSGNKTRFLLLGLAGILLIGAVYYGFTEWEKRRVDQVPVLVGAETPPSAPAGKFPALPGSGSNTGASVNAGSKLPLPIAGAKSGLPISGASASLPQPAAGSGKPALPLPAVNTASASLPISGANPKLPQPGGAALPSPVASAGKPALPLPGANQATTALPSLGAVLPGAPNLPLPADKSIPATLRATAIAAAKGIASRADPCAPLRDLKPFPHNAPAVSSPKSGGAAQAIASAHMPKLVPPPPPGGPGLPGPPDELSVAELPAPPAKPTISGKLKLVAVIGDKAIMSFADRGAVRENKWPQTVTLGPGEQFESISVVGVNGDSVTLEEDGERSVKTVEPVR